MNEFKVKTNVNGVHSATIGFTFLRYVSHDPSLVSFFFFFKVSQYLVCVRPNFDCIHR